MRILLFVFLSLISGISAAADYYWVLDMNGSIMPEHYQTGMEACSSLNQRLAGNGRTYYGKTTSNTSVDCFDQVGSTRYASRRMGTSCPAGTTEDPDTGFCLPPSDAECRTKNPFDVRIQFSMTADGVVFSADPKVVDHCVFEPGEPKGCTDVYCDVPYTPVGNDVMGDNSDDPQQDMQDYLDELAKQFDCQKTNNGTVGCSNSQTTPPDIDPDNKCPNGYSWSGTSCFATPGGPADRDNSGPTPCTSNCGGNTGGGDTGGGDTGGGDTGGGDTGGGNTGGGGGDNDGDSSVTGTACDQIFKCTGDAVNCAIAEKQRASYCEAHELSDSKKGFEKIKSELGDEKYSLNDGGEVDVSTMFGQGTRFLPSSCPGRQAVSLHIGPISFDWQPVCTFAEAMGKIGVALASLFFAVYVGRSFGGE